MGIEMNARYIRISDSPLPPSLTIIIVYYFLFGQAEQPVDFGVNRG
jgi:hypothetical protein